MSRVGGASACPRCRSMNRSASCPTGCARSCHRPRGAHDLLIKLPYYAKVGVAYHWLVDLEARAVTAQRLESGRWVTIGVYGDETEARIEPFDVVPIDVASWWPPASPP